MLRIYIYKSNTSLTSNDLSPVYVTYSHHPFGNWTSTFQLLHACALPFSAKWPFLTHHHTFFAHRTFPPTGFDKTDFRCFLISPGWRAGTATSLHWLEQPNSPVVMGPCLSLYLSRPPLIDDNQSSMNAKKDIHLSHKHVYNEHLTINVTLKSCLGYTWGINNQALPHPTIRPFLVGTSIKWWHSLWHARNT